MPGRDFPPDTLERSTGQDRIFWTRTRRGMRPRPCEDEVALNPLLIEGTSESAIGFFGVFDGHGGGEAAQFSSVQMPSAFAHFFREIGHQTPMDGILRRAFLRTDEDIVSASTTADILGYCGTTAVVAVFQGDKVWIANAGDSRAVLGRAGQAHLLTTDHTPTREDELRRIEASGGNVLNGRVNGMLAVSRALGDRELKPFVSAEPDIQEIDLTDTDDVLILASDGLWIKIDAQEAVDIVYRSFDNVERATRSLVERAWALEARDDISIVVVFLSEYRYRLRFCPSGLEQPLGDGLPSPRSMPSASANF